MSKFKVGDKVKLVRDSRNLGFIKYDFIGEKGIIKTIESYLKAPIEIKFDRKIKIDNWFVEDDLELVSNKNEKVIFKVGDQVEFSSDIKEAIKSEKTPHYTSSFYKRFINSKGVVKQIISRCNDNSYAISVFWPSENNTFVYNSKELVIALNDAYPISQKEVIFEVGDEVEMLYCKYHGIIGIISEILDTNFCYVLNDSTKNDSKGLGYLKNNINLKLIKKHNFNNSNQLKNHEQTKNNDSGQSVNLSRTVTTVTRGKNLIGSSIKGRRSRITITIGSYCNQAISC